MFMFSPNNELIPINNLKKGDDYANSIVHYTSIANLFKILRGKQIKFNRIDNVNDLEEKELLEFRENYRRVFVACFSKTASDRIPMWKMYTNKNDGVMIKIVPFEKSKYKDLLVLDSAVCDNKKIGFGLKNVSLSTEQNWYARFDAYDVEYTDDKKTKLSTLKVPEEQKTYDIPDYFGRCKNTAWKYEEEFRFRIVLKSITHENELQDLHYLFVNINFDKIKRIEITFSPNIDKSDWEDIIDDFRIKQDIKTKFTYRNSRLFGKIKL